MKLHSFMFKQQTYKQIGLALLLALLWQFTVGVKPAAAHITLVRIDIPNAAQNTPAATVELWFDKPLVARFSLVYLVDTENQSHPVTNVQPVPTTANALQVTMPVLPSGDYMLFWKLLDATDSHFSQGFTVFKVDAGAHVQPQATLRSTTTLSLAEWILRWTNLVLLAGIVGACALVQLVLTPIQQQPSAAAVTAQRRLRQRLLYGAAVCSGGAFLGGLGLLLWQVGNEQSATLLPLNWGDQLWPLLTTTQWGALWIVRQGLLLFLSGGLWWLANRPQEMSAGWPTLLIGGRVLDLLIVQALAGHAANATSNWLLALVNATVHLLTASLWIGGLLMLALLLLPALRRQAVADGWRPIQWRSFSQLALLSVGGLLITGIFHIAQQVASFAAIFNTVYGQLLLSKLSFVLLAGLCGLGNALLVHPRLAARLSPWLQRTGSWRRPPFPYLIGIEVTFGILIFGLTGLLTVTPPPSSGVLVDPLIKVPFLAIASYPLATLLTPTVVTLLGLVLLVSVSYRYITSRDEQRSSPAAPSNIQ